MRALPYAFASCWSRLVDATGSPVWPIAGDDQLKAAHAVAKTFGARLVEVEGRSSDGECSSEECVGWMGSDARRAGELYAHLTERSVVPLADLEAVRACASLAVLVTTLDQVDDQLLWALCADRRTRTPGLLCAPVGPLQEREVLVRAAAAVLSPRPATGESILLHSELDLSVVELNGHTLVGGAADRDTLVAHFGSGADFVLVTAHSDGLDARLGELTLCGIDRDVATGDAPACVLDAHCHRHGRSPDQAWQDGLLLSPDVIRTPALILGVCDGLRVAGGNVDPAWSYVVRLIGNAGIGAIVTTWYIGHHPWERQTRMLSLLEAGLGLGEACARFMAHPESERSREHVVLLGDPRVAVGARAGPRGGVYGVQPRRRGAVALDEADLTRLSFLRAWVSLGSPVREPGEGARALLDALRGAESDAWSGVVGSRRLTTIREAVLCHCLETTTWIYLATRRLVAELRAADGPERCPNCDRPVHPFVCSFSFPSFERVVVACSSCRIAAEGPVGLPLPRLGVQDGRVTLEGVLPDVPWNGLFVLETPRRDRWQGTLWPADASGRPARDFEPSVEWPVGPALVSLVFVFRLDLLVLRRAVRGRSHR